MPETKFDLEERLVDFSCRIIEVVEALPSTRAGNYIAAQLIRCGLAPALLYGEAQGAESRPDFIHKMKIAYKEAEETSYWLQLCSKAENYQSQGKLSNDIISILKVLGKIISTSKS